MVIYHGLRENCVLRNNTTVRCRDSALSSGMNV